MKKRIGLTWMATAALLLGACGGESQESSGSNGDNDGKVTLKFHHWVKEDVGKWEETIAKFEEANPDIDVESIPLVDNMTAADYLKQLDLLASAGEQMDVLMFNNSSELAKRVDAGLVAPVDSFMEEEGVEMDEEYNNAFPQIDGSYYGLPMKSVVNLVMMNKSHLDEAGLEIPTDWTWEEYREYAKKLTTDDHKGSYFHTWPDFYHMVKMHGQSSGNMILNEDGSSNASNPLLRESLQLRYDLEQTDKSSVPLSESLSQKLNYRQQFFAQEVSMVPTASFMITEWGEFTPEFEIAWAPWPKNSESDPIRGVYGGDLISIAESSENKEEAYKFIRWMTTEGIVDQSVWVPSWTGADTNTVLEDLIANTPKPEAVHLESLKHVLSSTEKVETFIPKGYITEALNEMNAEAELYLLGEQDLDTTVQNMEERVQAVVDANQ